MSDEARFRRTLVPSSADRERWLTRLDDPDAHREISAGLACLTEPDVEPGPAPGAATGWLRAAVWNIERGRDPGAIAALIASTGADVALLSEVDIGMGRTSNRDVAREIGGRLGAGSVFGVEFVELGLGKTADLEHADASQNTRGLHGNAIVGRGVFERPEVIRLDDGGAWFTAARGEPRVGGRCAVAASIALDGTPVDLVSVHLESHSDGALRAEQMGLLFERIDARGRGPAIVAGDLNTFGAPLADVADRSKLHAMRELEPARFSWPVPHEPLFEVAAAQGFTWADANVAAPTTRHDAAAMPDHVPIKLDWILVRGLEARRPTVVPALGPDGVVLSDHEMLAVSVRLPR